MLTYDQLIKKHKILQRKRVNPAAAKEPFHAFEGFGIECGAGWYGLLDALCTKIEAELIKTNNDKEEYPFQVEQIKEKFGGLRFYISSANDTIYNFINEAENKSYKICELCGQQGKAYTIQGWMLSLCKKCGWERLDQWEKDVLKSIEKSKQTIRIFEAKKITTEAEDKECDECHYWIQESKKILVKIDEIKKRDEVTEQP